jgi:hypothetical protein
MDKEKIIKTENIEKTIKKPDNSRPLMRHNICEKETFCRLPENHTGRCSNAECKCGNGFAYHICPTKIKQN